MDKSNANKCMLSVGFILLPDFTLSALAGFVDTVRLSADENFGSRQVYCSWTILNVDLKPVKSSCGAQVLPWETLRRPIDFDCIVVIGGLVEGHQYIHRQVTDYIAEAHQQGKLVIGLCTGSFALAYAGLMKHRVTCVHWFHKPDFQKAFPDHQCITDVVYWEDDRCLTCAGGGASGDVAAYVVERYCGKTIAKIGVSGMLMASPRNLHSPQPHLEADWFHAIKNPELRRLILIMDRSIQTNFNVNRLAEYAGLHKAKIDRLFNRELGISAASFFRTLRLAHGNRDILHTDRTITDIAIEYGFSDSSHFAKLYRAMTGITPTQLRDLSLESALSELSQRLRDEPEIVKKLMAGKLFFSSYVGLN